MEPRLCALAFHIQTTICTYSTRLPGISCHLSNILSAKMHLTSAIHSTLLCMNVCLCVCLCSAFVVRLMNVSGVREFSNDFISFLQWTTKQFTLMVIVSCSFVFHWILLRYSLQSRFDPDEWYFFMLLLFFSFTRNSYEYKCCIYIFNSILLCSIDLRPIHILIIVFNHNNNIFRTILHISAYNMKNDTCAHNNNNNKITDKWAIYTKKKIYIKYHSINVISLDCTWAWVCGGRVSVYSSNAYR